MLGQGRLFVITLTMSRQRTKGTVFEALDGTWVIVTPAQTRQEADAVATLAGLDSIVFAVRPAWSCPAKELRAT